MPVRITSKRDGFRRGGIAHSGEPTTYADDRFSAKQLARLKAEPMLIVEVITINAPEPVPADPIPTSVEDLLTHYHEVVRRLKAAGVDPTLKSERPVSVPPADANAMLTGTVMDPNAMNAGIAETATVLMAAGTSLTDDNANITLPGDEKTVADAEVNGPLKPADPPVKPASNAGKSGSKGK